MLQTVSNVKIAGVNGAIPDNVIFIDDLVKESEKATASKIKRTAMLAGLKKRSVALEHTTSKDLAITAGRALLKNLDWDPKSVDMLFFVTHTPDFLMPATGYLTHHALDLSDTCIVTDIIASCSGLIHGIWVAASHLNKNNPRIVVFAGDTYSKLFLPEDVGNIILFGDGVGAVALEYSENPADVLNFNLTTYPDTELALVVYGSGTRKTEHPAGFSMRGDKVVEFSQTKTIENINTLLYSLSMKLDDLDVLFSHQPNLILLEELGRALNMPMSKIPISIDQFGNCSSANIALLLSHHFQENPTKSYEKALFCGFGGGFAVASMLTKIEAKQCFPIEFHRI